MDVLLISPGFPAEMPLFTRGLASVGARVWGIGDQPQAALPEESRHALSGYLQVDDLWDESAVVDQVGNWLAGRNLDRVECLWEPGMLLAARMREAFGTPGLTVEQSVPFRDKERMKQVLDAAGIRTPRHYRARTAVEVREAAERVGFPLIVKPIDGAGSQDTHHVRDGDELDAVLPTVMHVPEVSVEEYVDGEEFTFDTVCVDGQPEFHNIAWYRPKPLLMAQLAWVSPTSVCLRDTGIPEVRSGRDLGFRVLEALGFGSGFTHMEWFRTPDGEAVFGEIGARPPGARLVHSMNYSADIDLFAGWAEAVCYGRWSQATEKKFNTGMVFKRAQGEGTIQRFDGIDSLMARFGPHVANIELNAIGQPKQDHRQVIVGDGWIVVRHPDLQTTLEMTDRFVTELTVHAG